MSTPLQEIQAIAFDLFETLITLEYLSHKTAHARVMQSFKEDGLSMQDETFLTAYKNEAQRFIEQTKKDNRETHNKYWLSAALNHLGYRIPPDDSRIAKAVDAYFSAFTEHAALIPGTLQMLEVLKKDYRLGLLSNFTHAPAAKGILTQLGLTPFFDVILISGDIGYRKPHPITFSTLIERLNVPKEQIVFVGDNPVADIQGSQQAGLQPVWMQYVQHQNKKFAKNIFGTSETTLEFEVPTISDWAGLLALL